MGQRVLRLSLLIGGCGALLLAFTTYEDVEQAQLRKRGVFGQLQSVAAEINQLNAAPARPLRPRQDAVQELLARMVDDTELLGSSVRFDLESQLLWTPIKYGVEKARVSMSSAAIRESAMGYFSILWSLINERPVNIIGGNIEMQQDVVSFNLDLELFGLQGVAVEQ